MGTNTEMCEKAAGDQRCLLLGWKIDGRGAGRGEALTERSGTWDDVVIPARQVGEAVPSLLVCSCSIQICIYTWHSHIYNHGLADLFPFFAILQERLTSSGTSASSGVEGLGAAPPAGGNVFWTGVFAPPAAGAFFAPALSLVRVMPLAFSLSISCFRPAAVVGMAGLSMLRGSDALGAVDGVEVDGLLAGGLLVEPDMLGIAAGCWGAPYSLV